MGFKIGQKYRGTKVGAIFTGICLLLTFTVLVPVLSVVPGSGIQYLVKLLLPSSSRRVILTVTLVILLVLLLLSLAAIFFYARGKKFSVGRVVEILFLEYLILQPFGFYLLWATYLNFESDGQIMFSAMVSYPISSLGFIGIGFLLDKVGSVGN